MKATLKYKDDFLYVVEEKDGADGVVRNWLPVRRADYAEAQTLLGRPVTSVNQREGIYVDEEGNVYQLAKKGETKPIEVEHLLATEKTELEVLLEASLKGKKTDEQNGASKRMQRKNRTNGRKQQALQVNGSAPQSPRPEATASSEPSAGATDGATSEAPVQLNLRQKLAEVRRRIGYVQKRGHN